MTVGAVLRTQAVRPINNVRPMPASNRERVLQEARTCSSQGSSTKTAINRNPDHLLHSLQRFCNGRVPTLSDLDNLPDTQVCEVLGIMGAVHRRRQGGSSAVMLGCYQSLTKPLVDTLPAHCTHLNNASLIQLTVALANLCTDSKAPKGSNLLSVASALSGSATNQLLHFVLPELASRLSQGTVTQKQVLILTRALCDVPVSVASSTAFTDTCTALTPSVEAHVGGMDALAAMTMLNCAASQQVLIPRSPRVLTAYLQAIAAVDTVQYPAHLTPQSVLKTLWALHCIKSHSPDVLRTAMKHADIARLRASLCTLLMRPFMDESQRWDVKMLQNAAMGASILHMRDSAFVQQLCCRVIPDDSAELAGRPAVALLDLMFGAQRRSSHTYVPTSAQRRTILRGILQAGVRRERRWTAFECWHICRMLPKLDAEVTNHQFTRILSHTVWQEHTQLRQGSYDWEVVLTNPTLFTSRVHALLNANVPRGVLYAFCLAASEREGFYEGIKPRDTVTLLRAVIHTTGLESSTTVLLDAAVQHAEHGENMSYAMYAAAKLQRPEHVCRLWAALQASLPVMSFMDVFNVLWACARSGLGNKLDLEPVLDRLEQLLVLSLPGRMNGGSTMSTDLDPFDAAVRDELGEDDTPAGASDGGQPGVPGWLIAQIAWSLAEMRLPVKPDVAELLFQAVRVETQLNFTDYTNLLWAASRLSVQLRGSVLWTQVQQLWSKSLRGWRVKEICTTLWALGNLKLNPGHDVLNALLQRVAPHVEVLPLKHTVSAITGASFLNQMPDEQLLAAVEGKIACSLMQVHKEELSRSLFAFSRLGYKPERLLGAIDASLPHSAHILGDVHCAVKVAQCIATFDMDLPRLHAWVMKLLSQMDADQFPTTTLISQAVTAHRVGQHQGFEACKLPDFMVAQFEAAQQQRTHSHINKNQTAIAGISAHLAEMPLGPVCAHTAVPGGPVLVDILLPRVKFEGKMVAITVLGVRDTAINTGQPLGHWIVRCKLIESYGLHVISIADDAWVSSPSPELFLKNLLQDCTCAQS